MPPAKPQAPVEGSNWKSIAARWLFGQESNTVLLFLILAAIGGGAWYGVPGILRQIHTGYKEINDDNLKARQEADLRNEAALSSERALRDRLLERVLAKPVVGAPIEPHDTAFRGN